MLQREFISRVADLVEPASNPDRFVFVGFQGSDIVLGIMPDASDWKRTPERVAKEIQTALEEPGNAVRAWDPSVEGASKSFLLKTHKWNFTTWASRGLFDETMRNTLLTEPFAAKREHVKYPRSNVGFPALGSLDHWRCIDGIGKVGAVKDRFELSLLRHNRNGTLLELMHFSPGFFCFRAKEDGPVLCCMEDGRVRQRSDLSRKGDGKGPVWKFHSPSTVAQYGDHNEGQDLKERFAQLNSSVPGRWMVAISVPHVFIQNNSDTCMQIVLTAMGFVVLGGGADPQGLIVENNQVRTTSGPFVCICVCVCVCVSVCVCAYIYALCCSPRTVYLRTCCLLHACMRTNSRIGSPLMSPCRCLISFLRIPRLTYRPAFPKAI